MRIFYSRGQSLNEYSLIFAVILIAAISMQTYIKRGIQSVIKTSADQLAAPAQQDFKTYSKLDLDPQTIGVMESGIFSYQGLMDSNAADKPIVEISSDRNITSKNFSLEKGNPREAHINKDETRVTGKWEIQSIMQAQESFSLSEKTKTPGMADVADSNVELEN